MKLTPDQLAEIRANGFGRDDVVRLCEHIAAVERERDAAHNLVEEMRELQREMAERSRNGPANW